jgi:hypothetical protein
MEERIMGPFGIAAVLAVAAIGTETGRGYLKQALRAGLKVGFMAKQGAEDLAEKAKEYKQELVAEIETERAEVQTSRANKKVSKSEPKASS